MALSVSTAYPAVKGQGQNTWSRRWPQPQGAQAPQPNPQNLCGKNKNKEEKQLLILGFMVFIDVNSTTIPEP